MRDRGLRTVELASLLARAALGDVPVVDGNDAVASHGKPDLSTREAPDRASAALALLLAFGRVAELLPADAGLVHQPALGEREHRHALLIDALQLGRVLAD